MDPYLFLESLEGKLSQLKTEELYKEERLITSPQEAHLMTQERALLNFCSNNYLGLANHPDLIDAAQKSYEKYGFGLASVRFICGTQMIHKELEKALSRFLGTEDTILYTSCFDANGGLFEPLLGPEDVIISDQLNHASIIDGIRLCKAKRLVYQSQDMKNLEYHLQASKEARVRLIATDGVFSMTGTIAPLDAICELADRYKALVMVDDSHGVGVLGKRGCGTPEYKEVMGRIDILTGTLGKALGGASGGYTSGKKLIIEWLRQRSRPYLFSNTIAPSMVAASLKALELVENASNQRKRLWQASLYLREKIKSLGLPVIAGEHPIIPVMVKEARLAKQYAAHLLEEGIYVVGFSYPVVPKEEARIRLQISILHTDQDFEDLLKAFAKVNKKLSLTF